MEDDLFVTRPRLQALQDAADWLILNNTEDNFTANNITNQLSAIVNHFQDLADKLNETQNIFTRFLIQSTEFADTYDSCLDQFAELEVRFTRYGPLSVRFETLWKQEEEFSAYTIDVKQVKLIVEQLEKSISKDDDDQEKKTKIKELTTRIESLEKRVKKRGEETDTMFPVVKSYYDDVKVAFKNGIHDCEERYDKIKLTPTNLVACEKQMDVVEAIMEDLEAMNAKEKKMMAIQKKIEKIVEDVDNVADDSSLKEEVREFSSKWLVVQSSIRQKKHQLEKLKTTMLNFNKSVCTVDDELKRLQDRTADDFVIGIVDSTAGQKVLDDITAIRKEVDEFDTKVDDVNKCGKELTALLDEYKADSHAVASQITDINDDHQKVKDDLAAKEEESKKQIEIIDEFFKCSKHADEEVKKITKQKDELSALSAEPEIIKEQLSEVEVILDELRNLEPEQKRIEELCNDIVQHHDDFSVQSQARHMVKKITAPMDRLSLSLVERKSKLNNLLVGSQDLQDSFDDLGEKLLKIEKACAKLKPISAVYNVAKKQELTVQKLLDEVTSLAGSFEILARSVDELKHHTDAKEHDRVCKVKDKLKARWEVLHENLKKKNEVAESVIPVAQDYHERCIALSDWLVGAEKQLSTQEDLVVDEPAVAKELENVKVSRRLSVFKGLFKDCRQNSAV